jgi:hypothetical protein
MIEILRKLSQRSQAKAEFWLSGQYEKTPHPLSDSAIAAWSEFMGREAAELWVAARQNQSPNP